MRRFSAGVRAIAAVFASGAVSVNSAAADPPDRRKTPLPC